MSRFFGSGPGRAARTGARSARSERIRTALLAIVAPTVFFAVIELGTRATVSVPGPFFPSRASCRARDPLLGYAYVPRCVGIHDGTPIRTNVLGLRGDEVPEDGSRRILAIGDSCTWGYQVGQAESYPAVLQRVLDKTAGPGRYFVVNAGTPGFTSHHGLLYLRERGLQLHPALVLIGYEFNDGLEMGDISQRLDRLRRYSVLVTADDWLKAHSDFYRLVNYRMAFGTRPAREAQVVPAKYRDNVLAMVQLARDHGARPVLIDWNVPRSPYSPVLDDVSDTVSAPLVRYYGPRLPGDVVHPTAEGYRRFVTVLYERLRDVGYVDGK